VTFLQAHASLPHCFRSKAELHISWFGHLAISTQVTSFLFMKDRGWFWTEKLPGCDQLKNIPLLSLAITFLHAASVTQRYLKDELHAFAFTYKDSEQEKMQNLQGFPFYGCCESGSLAVTFESSLLPLGKYFPNPFS